MAIGLVPEYGTSWNRWMNKPGYFLISNSIVFSLLIPPFPHKERCIICLNYDTVFNLQNTWSTFMVNCIQCILLHTSNKYHSGLILGAVEVTFCKQSITHYFRASTMSFLGLTPYTCIFCIHYNVYDFVTGHALYDLPVRSDFQWCDRYQSTYLVSS
jgi:hypothetical protein